MSDDFGKTVSVVIPAYNGGRFIRRTLETVAAQTHAALEVIVVNDGSTDATLEIAEAFAASDPRFRVISTTNRGVARARNTGLAASRGEYVAFLDADDLWHPRKIEEQLAVLAPVAHDPAWAASYVLYRKIDEADGVIGDGASSVVDGYMFARHLVMKFVGNGSSLLVRRDAAIAVGGFDPTLAEAGIGGCEDLDFELKIAAAYKIKAVRQYLVGYRVYPGNMSSDPVRMSRSCVTVVERHVARSPLSNDVRRWSLAAAHRYALLNYLRAIRPIRALRSLATMLRIDPGFTLDFAMAYVRRAVRRMRARLSGAPAFWPFGRPAFATLEPTAVFGNRWERNQPLHLAPNLVKEDERLEVITFRGRPSAIPPLFIG